MPERTGRGQTLALPFPGHTSMERTVLHTSEWKRGDGAASYKKRPRLVRFFCEGTWRRGAGTVLASSGPALVCWLSHCAYV